jgi:AAA family ATP:ADP antiporter
MLSNISKQFFDIRRNEWPIAILMSLYFFFHILTFWVLKPMKRGVIVDFYGKDNLFDLFGRMFSGPEVEQLAKVLNMVVAYIIVIIFTLLVKKFTRQNLILIFCSFFSLSLCCYAWIINKLSGGVVWSFYVFGDMYNTAMLALFWAFMNDIVVADEAKRIYGIVGLGGVIGGFVGASLVRSLVEEYGRTPLLLSCIIPMILISIIGVTVNRLAEKKAAKRETQPQKEQLKSNAAIEGAKLVLSSKYLLAIAGIIGFYEIVSNIVDFQLSATIAKFIEGSTAKDSYFALVGQVTGIASIVIQLFLTSFVMKRFGVGIALLFLPISIFFGSLGFLILPTLIFATIMSASDNSLNYSINQSAKEALYVVTSKNEKYKAKAFIDMFVQRFAKVLAVVLNLGVVAYVSLENVRWLSTASILILVIWIGIVRFAGRRFDELATS